MTLRPDQCLDGCLLELQKENRKKKKKSTVLIIYKVKEMQNISRENSLKQKEKFYFCRNRQNRKDKIEMTYLKESTCHSIHNCMSTTEEKIEERNT